MKINKISDELIITALKKICDFLVDYQENGRLHGGSEPELEHDLALERTKKYEKLIQAISVLDLSKTFSELEEKILNLKAADIEIADFLRSLDDLHEFLDSISSYGGIKEIE